MTLDAVMLFAVKRRVVGGGDFGFDAGAVERELDGGANVCRGAGVIDGRFIAAVAADIDVPSDFVVGAGPVGKVRAVGGAVAALDCAVGDAVARRQRRGAGGTGQIGRA